MPAEPHHAAEGVPPAESLYDTVVVEEVVGDDDDGEVAFIKSEKFSGARAGYTFKSGLHGTGYYLDEMCSAGKHLDGKPSCARPWEGQLPKEAEKPSRDGVPLTEELIRRKAEHNEGMLSTLEEIALHQLDIDRIETLNNCRCLKIIYLQSNLIRKLEGLHRLKKLDYLNVALNNITKIENLHSCESLRKLDLTVNFIDLDELHTVGSLKNNTMLRELYLTGNPCQQGWEGGYRDYVIATLPQLELLDGVAITKSERIKAVQRLPQLQAELAELAPRAKARREELYRRRAAKKAAIAAGELEDDTVDEWCPETRVDDQRELREIEQQKEKQRAEAQKRDLFHDPTPRERRLFKDDGTPNQMNTAKWPFSIDDDGESIIVDLALPKFLDSAQIDADVQPTYVRVSAKKNTFQVVLPAEVLADASQAKRSATTGHLLLTCPKVHPIVRSKKPEAKAKVKENAKLAPPSRGKLTHSGDGSGLTGPVSLSNIVTDSKLNPNAQKGGDVPKEPKHLGADFSDEEEVPPLL